MLIGIFGESCTGKSTLAAGLQEQLGGEVYTGRDFLRMAKDENAAREIFQRKLRDAVTGSHIIYVVSEKEHLDLLPEGAVRILMTEDLAVIKERFAGRMHGKLPPPVADMLERKHGCFDGEPHDFHIASGETDPEELCSQIRAIAK